MTSTQLETALEKVSRVITERYGLRLVCRGTSCETDGETIYLPSLPENMPEGVLPTIRGWADHECAHAIFTETEIGPEFQQKHGKRAFSILNTLEDARVEELMAEKFPGSAVNLRRAFDFVSDKASKRPSEDPFQHFTSALYIRASGRSDQDWIAPEAYDLADECQAELEELGFCEDTSDVVDLALAIWEKIRGQIPDSPASDGNPDDNRPADPEETSEGPQSPEKTHTDGSNRDEGQQGTPLGSPTANTVQNPRTRGLRARWTGSVRRSNTSCPGRNPRSSRIACTRASMTWWKCPSRAKTSIQRGR
ncbi:MAG: hypothetical protein ACLFWL_18260 [Candidatus Brocadiia bacterium]